MKRFAQNLEIFLTVSFCAGSSSSYSEEYFIWHDVVEYSIAIKHHGSNTTTNRSVTCQAGRQNVVSSTTASHHKRINENLWWRHSLFKSLNVKSKHVSINALSFLGLSHQFVMFFNCHLQKIPFGFVVS
uniref:Secreted protein n=1 Tax=Cacopsylla melanoneura TaxID=428564 RepID=A0A8D8SMG1_9HEMI